MKVWMRRVVFAGLLGGVGLAPATAMAQVFGTFTWQMQPYCNKVTITLTSVVPGFALAGADDQCGAPTKASLTGVGVFNPNGTVGINFTIVTSPDGQPVHVSGLVNPANAQGTWSDSLGNTGTFAFGGSQPGLPPRPGPTAPVEVAENPAAMSDPCLVAPAPTLTLCGTSARRWASTLFAHQPIAVWRDATGAVHLRGSALVTSGTAGGIIFVLPPELRPRHYVYQPVTTGHQSGAVVHGASVLIIAPRDDPGTPGAVFISSVTGGHNAVHFGDITFRTDR